MSHSRIDFFGRFLAAIGGYVAALLAAGVANAAIVTAYSIVVPTLYISPFMFGVTSGFFTIFFGVLFAAVPAAAFILVSEFCRLRAITWYLLGGLIIGVLAYMPIALPSGVFRKPEVTLVMYLILLFGLPGMTGGLVYWLLAGRYAGLGVANRRER